ncbi:MAG: SEL1-like repeat protein [Clostridia bacterium]|nr:SEL1-like repeat protein [Clostridia bacterium]
MCYLEGKGVTENRDKAIALFEQAAAQGIEKAKEWLDKNT